MPDLSKLNVKEAAKQAATLRLEHPTTGEALIDEASGEPVTLSLVSVDSDEYKGLQRKIINNQMRRQMTSRKVKITAEIAEENQLDLLAACTKGWSHIVENGQEVPFSNAAARELYVKHPWIKEQAEAFINDRGNFLGNS